MNININKNYGFMTTVVLFGMALIALIGGSKINSEHKERYNFYGEAVSFAQEKEFLTKKVFYFDFDSYVVPEKNKLALYAHARKLLKDSRLNVCIIGHTDNKGFPTYNMKLGMLRAKAIADILSSKGVNKDKMIVISYANQVPIVDVGFNAEKLNRRVELLYQYREDNVLLKK